MGFIWWALPTLLTRQGVSLATITMITAAATVPWTLKFLAGPIIDTSTQGAGGLRGWIIGCQLLMAASLVPLAVFDWVSHLTWLGALLVIHAVTAATQDVAIDTLAMRAVPAAELGRINGWMQAGMLLGRAGVAGSALLLHGWLGAGGLVAGLVLLLWVPLLLVAVLTREPRPPAMPPAAGGRAWLRALMAAPILLGLWIAITAGAGFEFLGVAAGPLLVELGIGESDIGIFFAAVAPAGLGLGALAGGRLADRAGAFRVTATAIGLLAVLSAALAGALGSLPASPPLWLVIFGTIYAAIGILTTASYTLFMQLARGPYAATRFSALMAGTNACEAWAALAGGRLQTTVGYPGALLALAAASLLAVPAVSMLAKRKGLN